VCRELARRAHAVTVAGRDRRRAEELAGALSGAEHRAARADARDPASSRAALHGAAAAVLCAGPFADLPTVVAEAALAERVHYVDIADDRAYIHRLRALDGRFAAAGLCAAFGCSSLPGLSAALATELRGARPEPPAAARVCLFIGNRNPKGEAAIRSLVGQLGRPVSTPEGPRRGFADGEVVALPPPFGRRRAYTFDGPEHDLFPPLLGVARVSVKVAFELRAATAALALLARLGSRYGSATTAVLSGLGRLGSRLGSSGGAVWTELEWPDGTRASAAVVAEQDGQRMAALPAAVVADALARRPTLAAGARLPSQVVSAPAVLAAIAEAGFRVVR
jgi:hypothetical protein